MTPDPVTVASTLRQLFGESLQCGVPLAPYTTLRIGGPADFLLEASTAEQLVQAYRAALELKIPFYFWGGGSNVLIADAGLRGLVVIDRAREIHWLENFTVRVAGGCLLNAVVEELAQRGWADMTFAAGIPGTLGGALVGGAGAFGHLVHEYLVEAEVLRRDGSIVTLPASALGIGYRDSAARSRGDRILSALLGGFVPQPPETLWNEIRRIKAEREVRHPGPDLPSAGSFFKNLPPDKPGGHRIPAGKLLEAAGAKELRVGGASVFSKHANIIVNHGGATASDVDELAKLMAERVKEKFGIILEREVQYLC